MSRQIMKMEWKDGSYIVIKDDNDKFNPYKLYRTWYELTAYGLHKRQKLLVKYGDQLSCMYHLLGIMNK